MLDHTVTHVSISNIQNAHGLIVSTNENESAPGKRNDKPLRRLNERTNELMKTGHLRNE